MTFHETAWAPGTPCWVDLATADQAAAIDFYSALFGWDVSAPRPEFGGYANASLDGHLVCGLAPLMAEGQPSVWTTYLASADADATTKAIESAGGTVLAPVMDVMDLGRMAIVQAPDGGTFGIWQAGTHLGCGVVNQSGALVWNEYLSSDFASAKDFFASVFGHGTTDIGSGDFHYATLEVDGNTVGGVGTADAGAPYWRTYFGVDGTDQVIAEAVRLGATIVSEAQDSPFGRWASLADPQGAVFTVVTPPSST